MDSPTPILNDERAAEMLGTTTRRVRAWVRRGDLPGRVLPDGTVVVVLADLLKWVEAGSAREAVPVAH
jgi:helix-turn-helix protein